MFDDIEWETGIEEAFTDVVTFVPKLVAFIVILIVGRIVANVIRRVAERLLRTVKADDAVERSGLPRMLGQPIRGAELGATLLYWVVMLMVLKLALSAFGNNPISDLLDSMIAFAPKLLVAVVIIIITGVVADHVGGLVRRAMDGRDEQRIVALAATTAVWLIGVFAALDQVQVAKDIVDTLFTTITASLGAIIVIKFGVGGIWVARDRFWPAVYDRIGGPASNSTAATGAGPSGGSSSSGSATGPGTSAS